MHRSPDEIRRISEKFVLVTLVVCTPIIIYKFGFTLGALVRWLGLTIPLTFLVFLKRVKKAKN